MKFRAFRDSKVTAENVYSTQSDEEIKSSQDKLVFLCSYKLFIIFSVFASIIHKQKQVAKQCDAAMRMANISEKEVCIINKICYVYLTPLFFCCCSLLSLYLLLNYNYECKSM
jgi:hypothetical protein